MTGLQIDRPVSVYASYTKSARFARAFAQGCAGTVVCDERAPIGDIAFYPKPVRPGWPDILENVLPAAIARGFNWYYGDNGYFSPANARGDAGFYSVTRNAMQFPGTPYTGTDRRVRARFDALGVDMRPWRRAGDHILVCPPGDFHARHAGISAARWLDDALARIRACTDRPVRVRIKRLSATQPVPLARDLQNCWALVTYDSKAGLEALVAGVPVFADGPGALSRLSCADFSLIDAPSYPDRLPVFINLAANQWTLAEIRSGLAWRELNNV